MDIVIRNGSIVDGSGRPAYIGDIGISAGRINQVGQVRAQGATEIDATGKTVSPGFIDPHTHFDAQLLWDGAAKPAIEHGVTTIVPGNCSLSLAPLKAADRMKLVGMFNQIEEMPLVAFEQGVTWNWETFDEFVGRIQQDLTINVAPLVGHSVLRLWVMGQAATERTATATETAEMQSLLRQCLDAGAIGLSTSFVDMDEKLQPVPSRYADHAELDALCAVLAEYNRILQVVHEFYDIDLTIGRIDQLAELSLTHKITTTLSPLFINRGDFEGVDRVIARIVEQNAAGARVWPQVQTRPIDISFCFAVPSLLFIRLRGWYRVMRFGTPATIMAAFQDETQRQQLVQEATSMMPLWSTLILRQVQTEANQQYVGKTLAEIAAERDTTPEDVAIDLVISDSTRVGTVYFLMSEENLRKQIALPWMAFDSDAGSMAPEGENLNNNPHPRAYGNFARLLAKYVRDEGVISLQEAVRKLTSFPAENLRLSKRGRLKVGHFADITVFDPAQIQDHATFQEPHQLSTGMSHVFVNGVQVLNDGQHTGALPGRAVLRGE